MSKKTIKIDLNERDVFEFLNNWNFETDITGVLLEKEIISEVIKEIKLEKFYDLVNLLAISRPGPISSGITEEFIKRKRANEKIKYEHPFLKEILKETYGLILYQEQIEEIIMKFGGFSKEEAISMRKVLGKRANNINDVKKEFIERALDNGFDRYFIERLYEELNKYTPYTCRKEAFYNIGIILYIQAYLRVKYKNYFNIKDKDI